MLSTTNAPGVESKKAQMNGRRSTHFDEVNIDCSCNKVHLARVCQTVFGMSKTPEHAHYLLNHTATACKSSNMVIQPVRIPRY